MAAREDAVMAHGDVEHFAQNNPELLMEVAQTWADLEPVARGAAARSR